MKELHSKLPKEKRFTEKAKELISYLFNNAKDGDIYLIKGSNSLDYLL